MSMRPDSAPADPSPHRHFDFWIGDWDVLAPDGRRAGRNVVTLEQDGFLLVEHWVAVGGRETGTSFNYFDRRDGCWHQLYLDNSGNAGAFPELRGALEEGRMVLCSDAAAPVRTRWSWTPLDGDRVRQLAEESRDQGVTWALRWDATYVRRAGAR